MAKKAVKVNISSYELGREERAIEFVAMNGEEKLGELSVSKGGFRWYPKGSKGGHHHLTWERLAKLIEENSKRIS